MTPNIYWPEIYRSPAIALTLVCGPPAGGKTTLVKSRKKRGDVVIDLDQIIEGLGNDPHTASDEIRHEGLEERNRRLAALADERFAKHAWFVTSSATGSARERWARLLRSEEVILVLTPKDECYRRISADASRRTVRQLQCKLVDKWWKSYYPSKLDKVIQ